MLLRRAVHLLARLGFGLDTGSKPAKRDAAVALDVRV